LALGLCCQWLARNRNGKIKNILISRNLQKTRFERGYYTNHKIKSTYVANLENLLEIIPTIVENGIKSLRISSTMFPLFDLVNQENWENPTIKNLLNKVGSLTKQYNLRCTTHPGQFVVLNSLNPKTVKKAIAELNFHGWLFDQMGLDRTPYYSINIHGGKANQPTRLVKGIEQLNEAAKKRLTLENCELCYGISSLQFVSRETGVPLCFDSHHHALNPKKMDGTEAMEAAIETWPDGIKPITHVSNSKPEFQNSSSIVKRRAHSDYLRFIPDYQLEAHNSGRVDIDVEAKMKNFAIFHAVRKLGLVLS